MLLEEDSDEKARELRINAVCGANKQKNHCHMVSLDFGCTASLPIDTTYDTDRDDPYDELFQGALFYEVIPSIAYWFSTTVRLHLCLCYIPLYTVFLFRSMLSCGRARNKDDEHVNEEHRLENSLRQLLQKTNSFTIFDGK